MSLESNITIAVAVSAILSPILTTLVNNRHLTKLNEQKIEQEKLTHLTRQQEKIRSQWNVWFVDFFGGVYLQFANGAENSKKMLRDKVDTAQAPIDLNQPHIAKMQQAAPFIRYLAVEVNIRRRTHDVPSVSFDHLISSIFIDPSVNSANTLLRYLPEFKAALTELKPSSLLPEYTEETEAQDFY